MYYPEEEAIMKEKGHLEIVKSHSLIQLAEGRFKPAQLELKICLFVSWCLYIESQEVCNVITE